MFPEREKRRARAQEDLALAFFRAERDPLWAVVVLFGAPFPQMSRFYGVHHSLFALSQERAPAPFTPRKVNLEMVRAG